MLMRMWWRCLCRWWERVAHVEQGMHSKPAAIERVWESGKGEGEWGTVGEWAGGWVYSHTHLQLALSQSNRWQPHRPSTSTWTWTSATSAPRSGPCELCAINLASFGGQLVTQCETPAADASTHTNKHRERHTHKPRHTPILSPHTPKMKECGQKEVEEDAGK